MNTPQGKPIRRSKGFRKAAGLVENRLRTAGESRGFAVTRLLTHWEDVVGAELAGQCTPIKVSYAQKNFGATLTVLAQGAVAPMVSMQLDGIRAKVNACYGYNAISRVKITQTAPHGFTAGKKKTEKVRPNISAASRTQAETAVTEIKDPKLRAVLEAFGANIISKERD